MLSFALELRFVPRRVASMISESSFLSIPKIKAIPVATGSPNQAAVNRLMMFAIGGIRLSTSKSLMKKLLRWDYLF